MVTFALLCLENRFPSNTLFSVRPCLQNVCFEKILGYEVQLNFLFALVVKVLSHSQLPLLVENTLSEFLFCKTRGELVPTDCENKSDKVSDLLF